MSRAVLLPYAASSVSIARQRVGSELATAGVADSAIADAVLVTSELLSNSLRHAVPLPPPFPPDCVRLVWHVDGARERDDRWVEVAVSDGGSETLPRVRNPETISPGGRGLGIVQQLASRWGTEVDEAMTTVWAVVEAPIRRIRDPSSPCASLAFHGSGGGPFR